MGLPIRHRTITPSTSQTHTNTTSEAAFAKTVVIPANSLRVGDRIEVLATVKATATNSTDTLTAYLCIGIDSTVSKTSSTGLVLASNTAYDVADNDAIGLRASAVVTAVGTLGTAKLAWVGFGTPTLKGTAGSATEGTYLSTLVDLAVYVVPDWSAASASDVCHLSSLSVEVIPANPTESP